MTKSRMRLLDISFIIYPSEKRKACFPSAEGYTLSEIRIFFYLRICYYGNRIYLAFYSTFLFSVCNGLYKIRSFPKWDLFLKTSAKRNVLQDFLPPFRLQDSAWTNLRRGYPRKSPVELFSISISEESYKRCYYSHSSHPTIAKLSYCGK